jgi:A/G-specific adenine glycosylase
MVRDRDGGERQMQHELSALENSLREGFRSEGLTPRIAESFRRFLATFSAARGRDLPWRNTSDPYRILVSEYMLQQTQVERVLTKYPEFLGQFPDTATLARVPRHEVLHAWQGLGYNRRALALHGTARMVMEDFHGAIPFDRTTLESFPGIGSTTAGAIVVFSKNRPEVFIETNIRRVFIHLFFPDAAKVRDREIEPILEKTLDRKNPRWFYYALMDYGVYVYRNRNQPNPNRKSASYHRQTPFSGSDREIRGKILRLILKEFSMNESELIRALKIDRERGRGILTTLEKEGLVCWEDRRVSIAR